MTAAEKTTMAPHLAHFAKGYLLCPSGNTPALTNSRIVRYRRACSRRSPGTAAFKQNRPETVRYYYSNDQEYPTVGVRFPDVTAKIGPV